MKRPTRRVFFGAHIVDADEAEKYWITLEAENVEMKQIIGKVYEYIKNMATAGQAPVPSTIGEIVLLGKKR